MARLTDEEMASVISYARGWPRTDANTLTIRALDELEEHRAREGRVERDGVLLSEESVEKIREALEMMTPSQQWHPIFREAYALLPPKKKPTLLEAAKEVISETDAWTHPPKQAVFANLRAAIAREEGK